MIAPPDILTWRAHHISTTHTKTQADRSTQTNKTFAQDRRNKTHKNKKGGKEHALTKLHTSASFILTHQHKYTDTQRYRHAQTYSHLSKHLLAHTSPSTQKQTRPSTCTHARTHVPTHKYARAHTHIHAHAYMRACAHTCPVFKK